VLAPAASAASEAGTALNLTGTSGQIIANVFDQFQAQLSVDDVSMLQRAVDRAAEPESMALAGLVLAKLGVPLSMDALRAVFEALRADRRAAMFSLPSEAIHLSTEPATADAVAPNAAAFSTLLSEMLSTVPELQQKGEERDAVQPSTADQARNRYRR